MLRQFLSFLFLALAELVVCVPLGHRWKRDEIGITRCRRCKHERVAALGDLPPHRWR